MRGQWFVDASHGWLMVKTVDVIKLDIVNDISAYSYMSPDGRFCYLEEDRDATVFLEKAGRDKVKIDKYIVGLNKDRSEIRDYPDYQPEWITQYSDYILAKWS